MFLILLLFPSVVLADFRIAPADRVCNDGPKCVWASLETFGKHHKIKALDGIRDRQVGRATLFATCRELDRRGVRYVCGTDGLFDPTVPEKCSREKRGCVIALWSPPSCRTGDYHAVVLTHLDQERFIYYDPNDCRRWEGVRAWFDQHWTGWFVALETEK